MDKSIDAIDAAIGNYQRWIDEAEEKGSSPQNVALWERRVEGLESAREELLKLRTWSKPIPAKYGDISDLPPELIKQLTGVKTDDLEDQIYAILKSAGAELELDRILIELFRTSGEVYERKFVNNKCYRMVNKGLIHQARGKKGTYTINLEEDAIVPSSNEYLDDDDDLIDLA